MLTILALILFASVVWGVLALITGAYTKYQGFLTGHARLKEADRAEELFSTKFKEFTHAAKLGDRTGIANGRFKLSYPKLGFGEVMVDITGFRVEGPDTLVLPDGTKIQLYAVPESTRNRF